MDEPKDFNSTLLHSPNQVHIDVRFSGSLFTLLGDSITLTPTYDENQTHEICRCPDPESGDVRDLEYFAKFCVPFIITHIVLPGLRNVSLFLWLISDKHIRQFKTGKQVYIFVTYIKPVWLLISTMISVAYINMHGRICFQIKYLLPIHLLQMYSRKYWDYSK